MIRFATILLTLGFLLAPIDAGAKRKTTQRATHNPTVVLPVIEPSHVMPDEYPIDPGVITIRGYSKLAGDAKESFLVTNTTENTIGSLTLLLHYHTTAGKMIHTRTVTVDLNLPPGQTKQVSIPSFDGHRMYYYYAGPKPRRSATPYTVAYRTENYTVPIREYNPQLAK